MLSPRFRQRRGDWVVHRQLQPMLTCPRCHYTMDAPAAHVGTVAICGNPDPTACGGKAGRATFVIVDGDKTRLATADDTTGLSDTQLETLKKARGRTR